VLRRLAGGLPRRGRLQGPHPPPSHASAPRRQAQPLGRRQSSPRGRRLAR
jgi:hypothetical protein